MQPRRTVSTFSVLATLALAAAARAAVPPLADTVPADALVYAGWVGSDACPGYDASHLKGVISSSTLPQVFTSFVPQVVRRVARLDDHAGAVLDRLVTAASPAWHHPTAFYFGGVDYAGPRPTPRLAILCDAGPDAATLVEQLNKLVGELPPEADPRPKVTTHGSVVVLSLGPVQLAGSGFGTGAESLAGDPKFTAALAQCKPDGAAVFGYVDVQAIVAAVDDGVTRSGNPDAVSGWPKARDALGLLGFRRVAATSGFEGKNWVERSFASTDGGKAGLLGLLDAKPMDADLLAVVPRTADRVSATRLDLAAGFDALRDAVAQVSPDTGRQVDAALGQVNSRAGINVRRDLLGSLGDQWVTYADRSVGGSSVTGSVLVNKLRDAARGDAAMTQLSRRLNTIIARQLNSPNFEVQFRESPASGTTLHYLAIPLVTPTWAVKNGYLYVGLYPQVVAAAIDLADRHGPSILTRAEFVATMAKLGSHPAASLSFTDMVQVAPDAYTDLLGESRLILGLGDIVGAHPPVMVVPPLRQVLDQLEPAGSVSWADAAGWHSADLSPFPGAEALSNGSAGGGLSSLPSLIGAMGQIPGMNFGQMH